MKTIFKLTLICVVGLATIVGFVFWLALFSERPPSAMDPRVLAGDGSSIDYCKKTLLDGSGLRAADIPKGNTPGCGYKLFPMPILEQCREPLSDGAADIRGLWRVTEGARADHVERVEQCGARTVITAAGIIHDAGPNSSGGLTTNDTEGGVFFTLAGAEHCMRTSASMVWKDDVLNFHAFGWGPVVVKRYLDGQELIWEYADGSKNRMERICKVPAEHRIPALRGRRLSFFDD